MPSTGHLSWTSNWADTESISMPTWHSETNSHYAHSRCAWPRFAPCLKDKRIWVRRALTIEKAGCVCADIACAQEQQAALNKYIQDTKGVKVDRHLANKVAKAVLRAQTCISRTILRHKLKSLKSRP